MAKIIDFVSVREKRPGQHPRQGPVGAEIKLTGSEFRYNLAISYLDEMSCSRDEPALLPQGVAQLCKETERDVGRGRVRIYNNTGLPDTHFPLVTFTQPPETSRKGEVIVFMPFSRGG